MSGHICVLEVSISYLSVSAFFNLILELLRQCGWCFHFISIMIIFMLWTNQGRIQDFKLGGGAHLKKLRRAEGGAKIFWVFRVKNHDFTQTNHIFSNLGGGAPPPPGSAPANILRTSPYSTFFRRLWHDIVRKCNKYYWRTSPSIIE